MRRSSHRALQSRAAAGRTATPRGLLSGSDSGYSGYASPLVSRYEFSRLTGLTFDGQRNLDEALGYTSDRDLTPAAYRRLCARNGVATRLLTIYPYATWTEGITVYEDPDPETLTTFEGILNPLITRLDLVSRLLRADVLAGLGEYGAILIGAPVSSPGDLTSDLRTLGLRSPDDILHLTPFAQDRIAIKSRVKDPTSPRYGLVEMYEARLDDETPAGSGTISASTPCLIHWSRVLHVAEGCLESDLYGEPRLRAVYDYLTDLKKVVGGGSEAAWRRMDPGLQLDLDPALQLTPDEEDAIDQEVEEYTHGLSRVMRTRGVKLTPLTANVVNFGPNGEFLLQLACGTKGIPYRIFLGSERGELASTQDRNNWADRVSERRVRFGEPLIRQFIDRLIEVGVLPRPASYSISWPDIEELDEGTKADVAGRIALANKNQVDAGGGILQTSDEIRETVFGMGPLEEEDVKRVEGGARNDTATPTERAAGRWASRVLRR